LSCCSANIFPALVGSCCVEEDIESRSRGIKGIQTNVGSVFVLYEPVASRLTEALLTVRDPDTAAVAFYASTRRQTKAEEK